MTHRPIETCDVWELARLGGRVDGELRLRDAPRLAAELVDRSGALRFSFIGHVDAQGRPAARLEIDGEVAVRCDRCGEKMVVRIAERAEFFFVAGEEELGRLPIDDAPAEPLLGSRRFDLAGLVEDQAILALPLSPRHDRCSVDTASTREPAGSRDTQRPFEALAALRQKKQ